MSNIIIFYVIAMIYLAAPINKLCSEPLSRNRIIVKILQEAPKFDSLFENENKLHIAELDRINNINGIKNIKKMKSGKADNQHFYILEFPEGTDVLSIIEDYSKNQFVQYAEPDFIGSGSGLPIKIPNDTYFNRQWGLKNDGSFELVKAKAGVDIRMTEAWELGVGDTTIIVGIIDSGVNYLHPELNGRIWRNYKETPANNRDDDGNKYIDDIIGWDFANNDNKPLDDYGHGTNIAGIIAANPNNSNGYAGIDWKCKIMPIKALDDNNEGYYSWWCEAIYYAVDNGARVINMSLGGDGYSFTLESAIRYAIDNNVVIVASMMNYNNETPFYPAAFNGVIAVGSIDPDGKRSAPFFWSNTSGSNFGNHISVSAPGNYIYGLNPFDNEDYDVYWGGTSQAAPLVSGVASLLFAQKSDRTPEEIKSIIESSSDDQVGYPDEDTPGWDMYYGFGRLNAFKALSGHTSVVSGNSINSICQITIPCGQEKIIDLGDNFVSQAIIYDVIGRVIDLSVIKANQYKINGSLLPGVYFLLLVESEKNLVYTILVY